MTNLFTCCSEPSLRPSRCELYFREISLCNVLPREPSCLLDLTPYERRQKGPPSSPGASTLLSVTSTATEVCAVCNGGNRNCGFASPSSNSDGFFTKTGTDMLCLKTPESRTSSGIDDDDLLTRLLKETVSKRQITLSTTSRNSPVPIISVDPETTHNNEPADHSQHLQLVKQRSFSMVPYETTEGSKGEDHRYPAPSDFSPKLRPDTLTFIWNYRKVKLIELYRRRVRRCLDQECESIRSEPTHQRV